MFPISHCTCEFFFHAMYVYSIRAVLSTDQFYQLYSSLTHTNIYIVIYSLEFKPSFLIEFQIRLYFVIWIVYRFHHLKLYPEDESGPLSTKKPVVVESYDEVVISEPSEALFARLQHHPAVIVPRLPAGFTLPPGKFCLWYWLVKVAITAFFMVFAFDIFCATSLGFKMLFLNVFLQCLLTISRTGTEVAPKITIPWISGFPNFLRRMSC